jgi:hypothetical protein
MHLKFIFCIFFGVLTSHQNQVEAFDLINDLIKRPIGSLSEQLFNWNPFKSSASLISDDNLLKRFVSNYDEYEDANSTQTTREYHYGCHCRNYTCSCCAHVEVQRFKLNNTGEACINTLKY